MITFLFYLGSPKQILLHQLLLEVNLGMTQLLDFQTPNIHYQFLLMYEYILVKVTNNFVHDMPSFIPQYFRNSRKSHGTFGASLCRKLQ